MAKLEPAAMRAPSESTFELGRSAGARLQDDGDSEDCTVRQWEWEECMTDPSDTRSFNEVVEDRFTIMEEEETSDENLRSSLRVPRHPKGITSVPRFRVHLDAPAKNRWDEVCCMN